MPAIRFDRHEDTLTLLNPLEGFRSTPQRVELRIDPLLGHTAVVNPALADKADMLFNAVDRAWLAGLAERSAATCIFCPDRLEATPRFPPELIPEGRLRVGEATLFPNLYALARHHAVVTVSHAHFLELHEFTPARIGDALHAMQLALTAVARHDAESGYATLNANYLFPSGASLPHPHFQLLIGPRPYAHHRALLEAWAAHQAAHGRAYGDDLRASEAAHDERYIACQGAWHWLAAYAPLGHLELQAWHEDAADFTALAQADVAQLAAGLSSALRAYAALGHLSFNFSLYSQRGGSGARLFLRLIARQNPAPGYRCDDYFLQRLLHTEVILLPPETLARHVRAFFSDRR